MLARFIPFFMLLSPLPALYAVEIVPHKDGRIEFRQPGARWDYQAERWGMYEVLVAYDTPGKARFAIGDAQAAGVLPAGSKSTSLGTLYLASQGTKVCTLEGTGISAVTLKPAPEGESVAQGIDGNVVLDAKDAITHSVKMRYEPNPKKQCLGFWTHPSDWAEWEFTVSTPGTFEVVLRQGCGKGQGGSLVEVQVADQKLRFEVHDTGGFQRWKDRNLGTVTFERPGLYSLAVKPVNKSKGAVMDIREIRLNTKQTYR